MNLLYEKQRLYGMMFRGDGGGGGSGGDGAGGVGAGQGGSSSSGEASGNGSVGGDSSGDSSGDGDSGDSGGDSGGPSATVDGQDVGQEGITVTADADPADPADPSVSGTGIATNSVLSNLFSKGVGQIGSQISGLPASIISNMIKGVSNPSQQNQAAIMNSMIGIAPVIGPINGLMGMMGMPTIGSAIASLGGVPADSVAADTGGGGNESSGLNSMFGGVSGMGSGSGTNVGSMLGSSSGDNILASLYKASPTTLAQNQFLKDLMKQENNYG